MIYLIMPTSHVIGFAKRGFINEINNYTQFRKLEDAEEYFEDKKLWNYKIVSVIKEKNKWVMR